MLRKIIDDFKSQGDKVAKYRQGLELLKQAGFLDLLRKFGYPDIIDNGNNANAMVVQAARSHGFQNAVSHLEFFMEMYLLEDEKDKQVVPSFGADKLLLKEKLMTQDELSKIKGGKI